MLAAKVVTMQIRVSCGLIQELESPLLKFPGGKLPLPEGEGLSAALSRSVSESEIYPDLQASLHAPTNRRGSCLAGTLASDLPKTASNRVSTAPFRARVWQSRTGSASSGLPSGCLRCPSTYRR